MDSGRLSWVNTISDDEVSFVVDTLIYPLPVLFRTAYAFTHRSFLFLESLSTSSVKVYLARKNAADSAPNTAGEFLNDLIDQKIRSDIAQETRAVRELIVAQAFAEADLLDHSAVQASYETDPRGISK